jgi:hypothetical protein
VAPFGSKGGFLCNNGMGLKGIPFSKTYRLEAGEGAFSI